MDTTWSADEIFNDKLANLGNEAKRRLIELLAASLTFQIANRMTIVYLKKFVVHGQTTV